MKIPFLQPIGKIILAASFISILCLFLTPEVGVHEAEDVASLMLSGEELLNKGEFDKSIELYDSAVELAEKTGDQENLAKCHLALGLLYWNVGKLDLSSSNYDLANDIAVELGLEKEAKEAAKAKAIHDYYQQGKVLSDSNEFSESILTFNKAIDLAKELGSRHHELKCLRRMSINYWEMSEYQEFHRLNERALALARELNHQIEVARTLNHVGLYFWRTTQYSRALVSYLRSLEIARLRGNSRDISTTLNNIGIIYKEYGNTDTAFKYLFEALDIDRKNANKACSAIDLINIGTLYRNLANTSNTRENLIESNKYFLESLKIAREIKDINTEIAALNNLGDVFIQLEDAESAFKYLEMGIAKAINSRNQYFEGTLVNNIGNAFLINEDWRESKRHFERAIHIALKIGSYDLLWESYFGLGRCHELSGNDVMAAELYELSINIIDKLRSRISLDVDKAGFAKDKLQVYFRLVELYFKRYRSTKALNYIEDIFFTIEKAKSRAFLDLLSESEVLIKERLTPELLIQEKAISERIASKLREFADSQQTIKNQEMIRTQLLSLEEEYSSFLNNVRVEVPELSEIVLPEPKDLNHVRRNLLDKNTLLLEYFLGDDRSYLIAISEKNIRFHELSSKSSIYDSSKAYLKLLADGPTKTFKGEKASKRLYIELVEPIEDLFDDSLHSIVVIPDGILYYLPFESLIKTSANLENGSEFLVNTYSISYMPSATSLLFLRNSKKKRAFEKDLLAIGNPQYELKTEDEMKKFSPAQIQFKLYNSLGYDFSPLPYSEDEIRKISKFFEMGKTDIYLKAQANEHNFKEVAQDAYRVIHFACHGLVDESLPLRSALVLSLMNNEIEDGFLQAREIYNLRLGSDLVVLSACQTGRGKIESGEGIMGLQRVFFFAGARSVVSTLWEIGDKPTAYFMEYFYASLAQGNTKAHALRLAKIKMLNSKYSHPFFWAGFILSGEYDEPIF